MHVRFRSLAPVFASLLLLAACDKQAEKKADAKTEKKAEEPAKKIDEPAKVDEPPKTADVLTIGAAKLTAKDKPDEVVEITADGTVKMADEIFMKVSSDGKLSKPDGTAIGQVGADGVVTIDGKPIGVTLLDDGASVTTPDGKTATLRFAEDGTLTIDPKPDKSEEMTSEGCTGPVAKTCALVLMTFLLHDEPSPPAPTKVEVGPEALPAGPG